MPAVYEYVLRVQPKDIDALGHVHNLVYMQWILASALEHSAAQGWPAEAYRKIGSGWVVRSHTIKYVKPALEGDEVVVRTWLAEGRRFSCLRRYRVVRQHDEQLLASAATEWAYIDFATGNLARIPPEVLGAFEIVQDAEV
ncbi:MAG TPA: acyl-CoA thioesterase [Pirellulales bacterium]|jgi:acyl-CoA thioester hydrolase|nr:acyl-CoA thioesterase [Pirellulales bacterium]